MRRARPSAADTIFHWASITKTFTGIAILQLRDRGLLSLDDPAVKYLPELRQVHNPFGDMAQVTLRHLLSHSAGFRAPTWPWSEGKDWEPFEPPRYEQLQAMLPYTELLFAPGSRYSYSNPGIVFLGRIIEVLTNEDYEVYVDKNVLKPLGMHRSFFDKTPPHLLRHRSHSYFYDGRACARPASTSTRGVTVSNGGLNAPLAGHGPLSRVPARRPRATGRIRHGAEAQLARGDVAAGHGATDEVGAPVGDGL